MTTRRTRSGITPDDLIDITVDAWSAFVGELARHGSDGRFVPPLFSPVQVAFVMELVGFALDFPLMIRAEGLAAPALRWGLDAGSVLLAGLLDGAIDEASALRRGWCLEPVPVRVIGPVGACRLFRERVASGVLGEDPRRPSTWRRDGLHHAACLERAGLEELRGGTPNTSDSWFREAAAVYAEWFIGTARSGA